ncbi:hypothetical protein KHC23_22585 [Ancylobacter dichloromethanicus]|uniref:Lipoprotein n=1 Tax=Ancylobacter dichloromethanicus TaxID=518825 RepID=A0A9W6N138_9HYPH|nr:hypothetical protein [Ancylobacter dichloromethanicus]MBS7556422.1 hypothetical protein [Ancylobacter dichloromethanicus]GLK73720.1 hypothetical protein GCM10017643_38380 [Ancylobacter dichloromethanicus]
MKRIVTFTALAIVATALAGCAYKPLKAPCSSDEGGTPLAYSDLPTPAVPEALQRLDRCGPMRPI